MYLLYASKEVLILRINFVIVMINYHKHIFTHLTSMHHEEISQAHNNINTLHLHIQHQSFLNTTKAKELNIWIC